jgi:pSer/pThr/pTyr-binding forkhead associated (FHA) protein
VLYPGGKSPRRLLPLKEKELVLDPGVISHAVIGREPDCRFHVNIAEVSRTHAILTWRGDPQNGVWVLRDLESTNGLWFDGRKVGPNGIALMCPGKIILVCRGDDPQYPEVEVQFV